MSGQDKTFAPETVPLAALTPHPRNYRAHPDDQLEHLKQSLTEHGWYRNVLVARDGTILAGHGVVAAARALGLTEAPVVRLDLDPGEPRALKVLAADNELARLAEVDDRALSELLKEVKDFDVDGLLGTGYDAAMLANLVMVTRPQSEIKDFDAAAEWAGMPEYERGEGRIQAVVNFLTDDDRAAFLTEIGAAHTYKRGEVVSLWWPPQAYMDTASVRFKEAPDDEEDEGVAEAAGAADG